MTRFRFGDVRRLDVTAGSEVDDERPHLDAVREPMYWKALCAASWTTFLSARSKMSA